jgi:hypothetical protein
MSYECKCNENKHQELSITKSLPSASRTYLLNNRLNKLSSTTHISSTYSPNTATSSTTKTTKSSTLPYSRQSNVVVPFSSINRDNLPNFSINTSTKSNLTNLTTLSNNSTIILVKTTTNNSTLQSTKTKYDYDVMSSNEISDNNTIDGIREKNGNNKKNSLKNLNTPPSLIAKSKSSSPESSNEIIVADMENKKPCIDFNPCKHGKCVMNNETNDFECECNVGYMGPFCDLIRHPCDFKPCENGICEIVGDLYYKCLCKPNYTGVNCHIELKPCDSNTCLNGGKCKMGSSDLSMNGDADFVGCDCPANFTGTYCENGKFFLLIYLHLHIIKYIV